MDTDTPEQVPVQPVVMQHEPHTVLDAADEVLKKRRDVEVTARHEKEERRLKGFSTVHICPTCKKRIHPRIVNGVELMGACPYCKEVVQAQPESFYTGIQARPENRYAKPDPRAFEQGQKSRPATTLFRRVSVVQSAVEAPR